MFMKMPLVDKAHSIDQTHVNINKRHLHWWSLSVSDIGHP